MMPRTALDGIRVLDLGDFVSAPFCARLLGDLGAEVVKVESLDGDSARRYGPFRNDIPDAEASGLFLYLNSNKASVTLNWRSQAGRELLEALLDDTDIVVLDSDLSGKNHFTLDDLQRMHQSHPNLIVVAITPFGLVGRYSDYAAYDINVSSIAGATSNATFTDREPLMMPTLQVEMLAGLGAAFSTMAALLSRARHGQGQIIDFAQAQLIGTQAGGAPGHAPRAAAAQMRIAAPARGLYPNHVLPCSDGYVYLFAPQIQQWLGLVAAMGEPDWTKERRFRNRRAMSQEYPEESDAHVSEWLRAHTKLELLALFLQHRVPSAPLLNAKEVLESAHLLDRRFFDDRDHPVAGPLTYPGFQFRMSATPMRYRRRAPLLGEHNDTVFGEQLQLTDDRLARLRENGVI